MKDTNTRLRDAEIEISKLAKTARKNTSTLDALGENLVQTQGDLAETNTLAEENASTIATLTETLDSVKARAEANTTNITNARNKLETVSATATENAQKILTLQGGSVTLTDKITALETAVAENTSAIAENASGVEQNTTTLAQHTETLTDFDTSIKFLSNTSSDLLERVAHLESNSGTADTSELEEQIAQMQTQVDACTSTIEGIQTTVATLQSATQVNATNIAENTTKITENTNAIAQNTTKIAGIQETYRVVANALNRITELEKLLGLAEEVWGGRGTSVEEITALLDDYATESNFCTETTTHLQFGTFGDTGPSAKIFFRQNPLRTTNPNVVLRFDFSNLPSDVSALPCEITLNGVTLFSGSLTVDTTATEFQATADLPINPTQHSLVMFNEINVQFNDTALSGTILDFVEVEITNSQNCIVLNRANHVNIYGWANKTTGKKRLICSKYYKGEGFKNFISTGDTHLVDLESSATAFPATTENIFPIFYSSRYTQENYNINSSGKFTTTSSYQLDYYITNQNRFYIINTRAEVSNLTKSYYPYLENVLYAKKSLHGGENGTIENALVVYQDFSIGVHYGHYYIDLENSLMAKHTLTLTNKEYPKEFIDFIPVYDYMIGGSRTTYQNVGFFILHKSGNILFVPERDSSYFIKIGKGRQVTASYHTDMMGIDVFYEQNGKIYKKVLERTETNSTEWTLCDSIETIENADCIFDNDLYQFKINKGEITQIIKT